MRKPEHWMAVRYVRWLTRTQNDHTVVSQLQERGRCILEWYLDLEGDDWLKPEERL